MSISDSQEDSDRPQGTKAARAQQGLNTSYTGSQEKRGLVIVEGLRAMCLNCARKILD